MQQIDFDIDVSEAVGTGRAARVSASVMLPDPERAGDRPVVCIALPSSTYARGYYTRDLPGAGSGAQAAFHAARGWIFVALDWVRGADGAAIDPEDLTYPVLTATASAAQAEILLRLANGVLAAGFPPVTRPCVIGIGHSLGAALLVYQQARQRNHDGIAVLGFSAIHSRPATPPGGDPVTVAWYPRDATLAECAEPLNAAAMRERGGSEDAQDRAAWEAVAWGFHYDDVPADIVTADLAHYASVGRGSGEGRGKLPPWYAGGVLGRAARSTLSPGIVAMEAAAIDVPVLVAMGERDLVPDAHREPAAYALSSSVDVFVCPRMGHVHNMAGTRALLWERLHLFGTWCAEARLAALS